VISTDFGAGNYGIPGCETAGGDGGKLQAKPRVAGCTAPAQPYISYSDGVTNIKSATQDPIESVKEAFQCIATIGSSGCGFRHTIEAARRALDPKLNVNPGFLRRDANLALVFLSAGIDCSAQKPQLFDTNQSSLTDPLGPLTDFRCFEFGVQCDINDRTKPGPRQGCKPAYDWLYRIDDYFKFFSGLKPPGRVLVFAIAGPTGKVEVGMDGSNPTLMPSCQSGSGGAPPAIRLRSLVDRFGNKGLFNKGIDPALATVTDVNICSADYGPALRLMGRTIGTTMVNSCLELPPLTEKGAIACQKGDTLGTVQGKPVTCQRSCLHLADCDVGEVTNPGTPQEKTHAIPRCDEAKFLNASDRSCGATCPCWRLTRAEDCVTGVRGAPYSLEILRVGGKPQGAVEVIKCRMSPQRWGSAAFAALPQCE
jgi:hypothetical protein